MNDKAILEIQDLRKYFHLRRGIFSRVSEYVKAVDGVSFSVKKEEILGLVGESGCGKTTTGRVIVRLLKPTGGDILFAGKSIFQMNGTGVRQLHKKIQMIFQDPYGSLNPRMTVGAMLKEVLCYYNIVARSEIKNRIDILLKSVGLFPEHSQLFPHEFSGGQRQRIGIARALSVEPEFIIADEPVSALDLSIQAQIINLLQDLKEKYHLTIIFITHDLNVLRHISDRIVVMYLGKIMEIAPSARLYSHPRHPYTEALLSAIPIPDPERKHQRIVLKGDVPSPLNPPSGCPFHPRCPYVFHECSISLPELKVAEEKHLVRCFLNRNEGLG